MTQRDKFQAANRLAAIAELNKPRDERAEMRPLSPAEVREREFEEVKGKRDFQRSMARDAIYGALDRILYPDQCGRPCMFDANVLIVMDDEDVRTFVAGPDGDRAILFRDNLRRKYP